MRIKVKQIMDFATRMLEFARLGGREGGQTLVGGTAAGDDLTLQSTTAQTNGTVALQPTGGGVTVGAPTGGDKGDGTLNAAVVYENGESVTGLARRYAFLAASAQRM